MNKKSFGKGMDSLLQSTASQIEKENKTVKQVNHKTIKPAISKGAFFGRNKEPKEKATFNLSKKLLQDLEDTWVKIRKERGDKKVSRTDIVEFSISKILSEFETLKQESKLFIKLVSNKHKEQ